MTEGGGVRRSVTPTFLLFETLFLLLFEGQLFDTKQDKASTDTFLFIHLKFQSYLGLKIGHQKVKNVTRGKVPKKCHVLFEWPLASKGQGSSDGKFSPLH